DDEQALGLQPDLGDLGPGPEPHEVLPRLLRSGAGRIGGVPARGAPTLPALGVEPRGGRVDRHLVDDLAHRATCTGSTPSSADSRDARNSRTDSAASAAEFSGSRCSATAHMSSPIAAAKPSTNHAPVS